MHLIKTKLSELILFSQIFTALLLKSTMIPHWPANQNTNEHALSSLLAALIHRRCCRIRLLKQMCSRLNKAVISVLVVVCCAWTDTNQLKRWLQCCIHLLGGVELHFTVLRTIVWQISCKICCFFSFKHEQMFQWHKYLHARSGSYNHSQLVNVTINRWHRKYRMRQRTKQNGHRGS